VHPDFWHERWRIGQIGFHQAEVDRSLVKWWPTLGVAEDARVYVPLCGKSLDLAWLAARGHRVIGSELSPIAIQDFFASCGLVATRTADRGFVRHAVGPFEIIEGDALALTPGMLGPVAAVYDRAALIALPTEMRRAYVASLASLLPPGGRMLLIALEYPQAERNGPPFAVAAEEIRRLYESDFELEALERRDVLAENPRFVDQGVTALVEATYALTRR
jgi:thiopurine S-methyltransferase